MNIVIDTSILRQDRGFINSDILLLKKLSNLDLTNIHIPWVVYKESTSQNLTDINSCIGKAIKELSNMNRKGISKVDFEKLNKIIVDLEKIKSNLVSSVDNHWQEFIIYSKAKLHEIGDKDGKNVMTSYFLGNTPFPHPKSRKDIPDSFIYEAIKSISKNYGNVHFICGDNNLRKSIAKIENCKAYESYQELYDSKDFAEIDKKYRELEHFADELILLKDRKNFMEVIAKDYLYGDLFAGNEQVIVHENIPSDGNEGALQGIENESITNIHIDKIQYIDGVFYIPIKMEAVFYIEYFLFKSDYYLFMEERNISILDHDWNDHYYLVQEPFKVHLSFKLKIEQANIAKDDFYFEYDPPIIDELNFIVK